jgi:hypothetical protein
MRRLPSAARWALLVLGIMCGVLPGSQSASAESAADLAPVDVVAVSGLIDHVVVDEIETALERSTTNGAQAVVLQVNSRGAIVSPERFADLLKNVADAKIPVAVWVGPTGARAYGLSAQLLTVADVSAMAPGSRIGFTGKLLAVNGNEVSFGDADATLRTSSLGFTEARERGALKYAKEDEGVPVVRNMLYALDGLTIEGKVLNTTVETLDDSGQIVLDAATARFFKLGLIGQWRACRWRICCSPSVCHSSSLSSSPQASASPVRSARSAQPSEPMGSASFLPAAGPSPCSLPRSSRSRSTCRSVFRGCGPASDW